MGAEGPLAALRILVLQIRDEPQVERQEQECFIDFSGLAPGQFSFRNLVERPEVAPRDTEGFDAVVIGGAGAHSVTEEYPFTAPLATVVEWMVAARQPLFGSCWGHQFIAKALGGTVVTDLARKELGTYEIELTPRGAVDPWLAGLPLRFGVQLGHHDRVVELPARAVELAASALCPNQAFRLADAPVYGAQFHVELDRERMLARANVYREEYLADHGAMASLERALRPSPESATLLRRFLSRVVVAGETIALPGAGEYAVRRVSRARQRQPSTDSFRLEEMDARQRTGAITAATPEAEAESSLRPALEANVILIAHPDNARLGTRYRLVSGATLEIGRSDSVEISLPEVRSISRSHARLRFQGRKVTVEDAGSTNGTFVNDQRVDGPTLLRSGDRFQVGSVHFKFLHEQDVEHAYHEAIYQMVMRDGLTEALNQRKFHEELAREFARAERHDRPLALVLFDIDSFKDVNDTHGHLCGDMVLKQLAASVREHVRSEQVFARLGGDEFAVLCPETAIDGGLALAEKLRNRLGELGFSREGADFSVTCSFGIAERLAGMADERSLFEAADRALYSAKGAGRNRVVAQEQPPLPKDP